MEENNQVEIWLTPDGSVKLITTGPVSAEVAAHLKHMLAEWWNNGQSFAVTVEAQNNG